MHLIKKELMEKINFFLGAVSLKTDNFQVDIVEISHMAHLTQSNSAVWYFCVQTLRKFVGMFLKQNINWLNIYI